MVIDYSKTGFSLYNYLDNLLSNPMTTLSDTLLFFQDKGYFNFSHFYKEFYDKSVSSNLLHYETILLYILICVVLFFLNKYIFKIEFFNKNFFKIVLPIDAIKSKSFKIDLSWFVLHILKVNSLFINLIASVFLLNKIPTLLNDANFYNNTMYELYTSFFISIPESLTIGIIFLVAFLVYDFANWYGHYLLHKVDFLWPFHQVHHYPRQLTIIAQIRAHPIDGLLMGVLPLSIMSVVVSIVTPYDPSITSPSSLLEESNILYIMLITFPGVLGVFNHTALPLTYGKYLGKIFISPMAHMVHHSRIVINKNMGGVLSIWDVIFGTYYEIKTSEEYFEHRSQLGLPEVEDNLYKNIFYALFIPFKVSFFILANKFNLKKNLNYKKIN